VDSLGKLYWKKSNPLFLFVSDNPEGNNHQRLKSERSKEYADPLFLESEGINYVRTRNAVDPITREVIPNTDVTFEIYADGTPPITKTTYKNAISYSSKEVSYYKSGLQIALSTSDNLSGFKEIMFSINGDAPTSYTEPLLFEKSGRYTLKYGSQDMVGNKEEINEIRFIIDNEIPYSDLNINGLAKENVIGPNSKLYIQAQDTISGLKMVYYKFDDEEYRNYNGKLIEFGQLTESEHTISYYALDNVQNKEEEKSFAFYFDKSAPIMIADVLGDRFIVGDEIYFSGRTKLKLTSVDNKVGVKEVMYSIDDEEYQPYTKPIYLPSVSGVHNIRFYSVDNLNNSTSDSRKSRYLGSGVEEYKHNVSKIHVDLTGPEINYEVDNYSFIRNDTLFIGPNTQIQLAGDDAESGFMEINYSLNDELGETPYEGPFSLSTDGYNILKIYGYDNVKNRNVDQLPFYQDRAKPEIIVTFTLRNTKSQDGVPVYPQTAGIFLAAMDEISGISKLTYQLDDGPVSSYAGELKKMSIGAHSIKVMATDYLNNQAEIEVDFIIE
jgi:hypothetical protein